MPGLIFLCALALLCMAPLLSTFHFCAFDGCITLKNWRRADKEYNILFPSGRRRQSHSDLAVHMHMRMAPLLVQVERSTSEVIPGLTLEDFQRHMWHARGIGSRITPQQWGLHLRLGHDLGQCPQPVLQQDFIIITMGGVARINVQFCGCAGAPSRFQQLMAVELLLLSVTNPRMAVVFDFLEALSRLS
ncbi:hypothetical protein DFH07DRAFT_784673 [Mycena maculata]|uniref:CxC2-like cysteine cluster KDZ transposase-associated domain-containing protein n=1 Tax=Mycena maculata TaxID=230809 RepID=A0AAD7MJL7_9AGAR|nr:hypothetical protein DFH07DRAFT_784673 [Mycena maculata]